MLVPLTVLLPTSSPDFSSFRSRIKKLACDPSTHKTATRLRSIPCVIALTSCFGIWFKKIKSNHYSGYLLFQIFMPQDKNNGNWRKWLQVGISWRSYTNCPYQKLVHWLYEYQIRVTFLFHFLFDKLLPKYFSYALEFIHVHMFFFCHYSFKFTCKFYFLSMKFRFL